jgi:hypothetical protein
MATRGSFDEYYSKYATLMLGVFLVLLNSLLRVIFPLQIVKINFSNIQQNQQTL